MRLFSVFLILSFSYPTAILAQFFDDFSDGDLISNPEWLGDTDQFVVNDLFELQLMAPEAGTSFIYTATDFPDSIRWKIDLEMDFSPSSSNKLRIYLALDNVDLNTASGYFLDIGENGSNDAIQLYSLKAGQEQLLASGTMGQMATDPSKAEIILERNGEDQWIMSAAYGDGFPELEFEFMDIENLIPSQGYFAIHCIYTSSRSSSFFFDNISMSEIVPDLFGPELAQVSTISAESFLLSFSEPIDEASTLNVLNYSIAGIGNPNRVSFNNLQANEVTIFFDNNGLNSGIKYNLMVTGVEDIAGNEMNLASWPLCLIEDASPGDLLINEILFDPYPGGEDFVEIFNNSNKFIRLDGLILSNDSKSDDTEELNTSFVLNPNSYVALSPDIDFLEETYQPISEAQILKHLIPSMNNESGNMSINRIIDGALTSIDSFDYHEDIHFALLSDTEGVSLERLSVIEDSNNEENWNSASSSVNYATPGYVNSQVIESMMPGSSLVAFEDQVFSPDGDGLKEQLIIRYSLDEPGYVGNIRIFDSSGFMVRELVSNELLSTEGFYTWDGLDDSKSKVLPVGMYIIMYQFFKTSGEVKEGKLVCVLATQL